MGIVSDYSGRHASFQPPFSGFEFRLLLLPFAFCDLPFDLFFLKGKIGIVNDYLGQDASG
jgi:hypothetical protein